MLLYTELPTEAEVCSACFAATSTWCPNQHALPAKPGLSDHLKASDVEEQQGGHPCLPTLSGSGLAPRDMAPRSIGSCITLKMDGQGQECPISCNTEAHLPEGRLLPLGPLGWYERCKVYSNGCLRAHQQLRGPPSAPAAAGGATERRHQRRLEPAHLLGMSCLQYVCRLRSCSDALLVPMPACRASAFHRSSHQTRVTAAAAPAKWRQHPAVAADMANFLGQPFMGPVKVPHADADFFKVYFAGAHVRRSCHARLHNRQLRRLPSPPR